MFFLIFASQTVIVKVPTGATGYGDKIPDTYSDPYATAITNANWGNGFRGGGWENSDFTDSSKINDKITVNIEYQ
jgi:hypothetical protein